MVNRQPAAASVAAPSNDDLDSDSGDPLDLLPQRKETL